MAAKPANPPTTLPTTTGVLTGLPADPAPEVAEDVGEEAVLPGPPMPPAAPPVLGAELDAELDGPDDENGVLEAPDEEKAVLEAEALPEDEAANELALWLKLAEDVKEAPVAKLDRDLVEVTNVLLELNPEKVGLTRIGLAEVVCAPDCEATILSTIASE